MLKPRASAYDLYWYFAAERQAAYLRRLSGAPGPWSADPILRTYKFCNVYRAADRVSQYLIREIAYGPHGGTPADRLMRVVAFRLFSKIETWNGLRQELGGEPTVESLDDGRFAAALERVKARGAPIYTAAFILCAADPYGFGVKSRTHVELLRHMFGEGKLAERLLEAPSLEAAFRLLLGYPLIGRFMAYQIVTDLNYTDLLAFDEDDFTAAGPGALRGIRKAFTDIGAMTPDDVVHRTVNEQEAEFARLGLPFAGLGGRRLHAVDCQGLFCELDKYCRVALPELTSARVRIKAPFRPLPSLPEPFFPPKWGVRVPLTASSRSVSA